jgi:hypothetical protein
MNGLQQVGGLFVACVPGLYGIVKMASAEKTIDFGDGLVSFVVAVVAILLLYPPNFAAHSLRRFFKKGDIFARRGVFAIAIGGTLLSIKLIFNTHLISDQFDFIFKRLAAPSVLIVVTVYCTALLSKVTFYESDVEIDADLRKYEAHLYWTVVAFAASCSIFAMGWRELDGYFGRIHDAKKEELWFDPQQIFWSDFAWKVWFFITVTSVIWMIYSASAVISRNMEKVYRDRWSPVGKQADEIENTTHPPSVATS